MLSHQEDAHRPRAWCQLWDISVWEDISWSSVRLPRHWQPALRSKPETFCTTSPGQRFPSSSCHQAAGLSSFSQVTQVTLEMALVWSLGPIYLPTCFVTH